MDKSKTLTYEIEEKFGLIWQGKSQARQLALTPSLATLRPCRQDSENWETTSNLLIEGDNLEVLKLLQKSYADKVKLIYIDPPYNTGKDFVYRDNYHDNIKNYLNYLKMIGRIDNHGKSFISNNELSGRFHTRWLNMMYPRLYLSRNLLQDNGIIAISIDDNEIEHLRMLCSEIFGEENFVAQVIVQNNPRGRQSDTFFATVHEYLLIYAKRIESCSIAGAALTEDQLSEFKFIDNRGKQYRLLGLRQRGSASLREDRPEMYFPVYVDPQYLTVSLEQAGGFTATVYPRKSTGEDGRWMWGKEKCRRDLDLLVPKLIERRGEFDIFVKDYLEKGESVRLRKFKTIWDDKKLNTQNGTKEVKQLLECAAMSFPKPVAFLQDIIQLATGNNDLVLDFFAGSGTTGHAIYLQNARTMSKRRWILVQLPEPLCSDNKDQKVAAVFCERLGKPQNLAEITKERLRRAARSVKAQFPLTTCDLGFRVFKLRMRMKKATHTH